MKLEIEELRRELYGSRSERIKSIDLLFNIERDINGLAAEQRLALRTERSALLVAALEV